VPNFSVSCRRLTPGPGYLEALCEDNVRCAPSVPPLAHAPSQVTLETTAITRVTRTGVELSDGRALALDVLVCATGFDTSYRYPFALTGRNGLTLHERWTPHAEAYLTLAVDGFPNAFWGLGPNSGVNSGSLLVLLERQVDYAVAAAAKMQRERIKALEVKRAALDAWTAYMRSYWPKVRPLSSFGWHVRRSCEAPQTVFMDACNSWYRAPDGAIVGIWPGSCLHAVRTLSHPRWEDFDYTPLDDGPGITPLYWLGDGQSYNEKTMTGDREQRYFLS
jgi:hypothetical protein